MAPGSTATFSCGASGEPSPTFTWTKDGQTVVSSSQTSIQGTTGVSVLSVSGVDGGAVGTYRCVAVNTEGTAVSEGAELQLASKSHDNHVTALLSRPNYYVADIQQ